MDVVDAPASHGEVEAVAGELREIDAADIKQPTGLLANCIENDGRLCALRDQRLATAARLLVGESMQLFFRLGIRDRGCEGSVNWVSPGLGITWQPDRRPASAETTPPARPSTTMGIFQRRCEAPDYEQRRRSFQAHWHDHRFEPDAPCVGRKRSG